MHANPVMPTAMVPSGYASPGADFMDRTHATPKLGDTCHFIFCLIRRQIHVFEIFGSYLILITIFMV